MEDTKVPAGCAGGEEKNWRPIVDEPTADLLERLRMPNVREPFRSMLISLTPLVKGSLRFELDLPDDKTQGENNG